MKFNLNNTIDRRKFYLSVDTNAKPYDELFGLSIGRIYWGWYKSDGLHFGWLDDNEALVTFRNVLIPPC
jgi:hypothetical protein